MLVCGFTGLSAENMKLLREQIISYGLKCRVETEGDLSGLLCFLKYEEQEGQWENLLKLLSKKEGVIPFFFKEGDRYISLDYGKECINKKAKIHSMSVILKPLLNILSSMIWLRTGSIIKSVILKENGNN